MSAATSRRPIEFFRKKGVKTSVTERAAKRRPRARRRVSRWQERGVIVEVKCNTDFAAKSELVGKVLEIGALKRTP